MGCSCSSHAHPQSIWDTQSRGSYPNQQSHRAPTKACRSEGVSFRLCGTQSQGEAHTCIKGVAVIAWKVVHINQQQERHELHVLAPSSASAENQAEALWGPAVRCACINLSRAITSRPRA